MSLSSIKGYLPTPLTVQLTAAPNKKCCENITVPAAQMNSYGIATCEIGGNTLGGASSGASFNGLLSEVQVYDRALTPVEVQGIYAP